MLGCTSSSSVGLVSLYRLVSSARHETGTPSALDRPPNGGIVGRIGRLVGRALPRLGHDTLNGDAPAESAGQLVLEDLAVGAIDHLDLVSGEPCLELDRFALNASGANVVQERL